MTQDELRTPRSVAGNGHGALSDIRVLDLSAYIAGPSGTSLLADMGADVIKVEPPSGDNLRNYPSSLATESRLFIGSNRGKRGVVLDLKDPKGVALLYRLAATADVVVHNFRPGVVERLGIDHAALSECNPKLIYAEVTGFGAEGPLSAQAGNDQVLQAKSGIAAGQVADGEQPELVHGSFVDYFTGALLALAVTGALHARNREGRGQRVGVSLLAGALAMQSGRFVWAQEEDQDIDRNPRSSGINGIFPTRDGYLYLQATTPHFWAALCRLLDCEDLACDPSLDTVKKRLERRAEIASRVKTALGRKTAIEWEQAFGSEVPCARVRSTDAMFEHPQVVAQNLVANYSHAGLGSYRGLANPIQFSGTPAKQPRGAPAIGQHTDEVLDGLGLPPDQVRALRAAKVIA
jgi:formyl-CoA transferase